LEWDARDVAEKLGVMIVDAGEGYEVQQIEVDSTAQEAAS